MSLLIVLKIAANLNLDKHGLTNETFKSAFVLQHMIKRMSISTLLKVYLLKF